MKSIKATVLSVGKGEVEDRGERTFVCQAEPRAAGKGIFNAANEQLLGPLLL